MPITESPRNHEVLDLTTAALRELMTLTTIVAGVIHRSRSILAKAEDVVMRGDADGDPVSSEIRTLVEQAKATIATVELNASAVPSARPRSSLN